MSLKQSCGLLADPDSLCSRDYYDIYQDADLIQSEKSILRNCGDVFLKSLVASKCKLVILFWDVPEGYNIGRTESSGATESHRDYIFIATEIILIQ